MYFLMTLPCNKLKFALIDILFPGYFNSTLNPLIYVMTNRDFKDAFTDILRRMFCWCCARRNDDGFGNSGGRVGGGGGGGGLGGSMAASNTDRLNVDYV